MKGKILDVTEKTGQKGKFYVIKAQEGENSFEGLAFNGFFADKKGQEIEYTRREKDGKHYFNPMKFPAQTGGGGGKQYSNPDTMLLSYAKDLAICFIEHNGINPEEKTVQEFMRRQFLFFKSLLDPGKEAKPQTNQDVPLIKNPEFHRGEAVKCPDIGGKIRAVGDCDTCEHKETCFAWN